MSMLSTPKVPRGFELLQLPTRGGQSAGTYSMLSNFFPELLQQAKGAPGAFQAIEQQGQDYFNQQLAPQIAARYSGNAYGSGPGISGISSSSGMQNSLAAAAKGLTLDLQAQRANLMQNSMRNVLDLGQLLLQNPDQQTFFGRKEEKPSFWDQLLSIGLPATGGILGGIFGGLPGAKIGSTVGSTMARPFLS